MPTFVWTDEVPRERRHYLTPGKRYPVFNEDSKGGDLIDDEGQEISVYFVGSVHLDGRAWNVETVADPEPPADPSADDLIERLRAYENPNGGEIYRSLMDEAAVELERLRAGIRAEIDWHENEAANLRKLEAADAIHSWSFKTICRMRAEHYEAAATRLRALLTQPTPEPEGK